MFARVHTRVQPLTIPVDFLLPDLCSWYKSEKNNHTKKEKMKVLIEDYNDARRVFNLKRGTNYDSVTSVHVYFWLRCNPVEQLRTPYLDELLILAKVSDLEDPQKVIERYKTWVSEAFESSLEALINL